MSKLLSCALLSKVSCRIGEVAELQSLNRRSPTARGTRIFMLHIVNGEATLPHLEAANLDGHPLSWFDMLMEGPLVDGLRSDSSWELRARSLARKFGSASPPRATSKKGRSTPSPRGLLRA